MGYHPRPDPFSTSPRASSAPCWATNKRPYGTSSMLTEPPATRDSPTAHTPATARSPASVDLGGTVFGSAWAESPARSQSSPRRPRRRAVRYSVPPEPKNAAATDRARSRPGAFTAQHRSAGSRRAGLQRRHRNGQGGRTSTVPAVHAALYPPAPGAGGQVAQSWMSTCALVSTTRRASPRPSPVQRQERPPRYPRR